MNEFRPVPARRDFAGGSLVPGYNVDRVDIEAGMEMAEFLGYDSPEHQMVAQYALRRHQKGEEDGAERTWLRHCSNDLTSWRAILSVAITAAEVAERRKQ